MSLAKIIKGIATKSVVPKVVVCSSYVGTVLIPAKIVVWLVLAPMLV